MPSGGGFSGGGGGGGFSGGGGYYGGSGRGGGGGGLITLIAAILIGIPIIIIVLPITQTGKNSSGVSTDYFSPGDSRIVSYSSFFCDGINLRAGRSSTGTSASIATFSNVRPSLTDRNSFNITDARTLSPREFRFYQYYLYPNSNITISACSQARELDIYLIRGNDNADSWQESPSPRNTEIFRRVLCEPGQRIRYTVTRQDEYYVFFHNSFSRNDVSYEATIEYQRVQYTFPSTNTSLDSCSAAAGSSCTVHVPYASSGSQQALVVTSIPPLVDWGENVDIDVGCNQRGWAIAVVILIPLLSFIALIGGGVGGAFLIYCCFCMD